MKITIESIKATTLVLDVPAGGCFLLGPELYLKTTVNSSHWPRVPTGYALCILLRSGAATNVDLNAAVTPMSVELTASPQPAAAPDVTGTSS